MASIQYVVNATDAASAVFARIALSADGLDKQLEDLGKRVADPEVNLEDSKFTLGMIKAAERLDKLSAQVADPSVEVDTAKAQTEILRINAMLDRLDAKRVSVTVDVDQKRGIFSRIGGGLGGLFGGGASAIGGGVGAAGSGIGALGSAGGQAGQALLGGGLAALIGAAVTTLPAVLPLGLGLLAGGGAAGGALMIGKKENEELQKLNRALASAKGKQKKALEQQIRQVQKSSGPELSIFGAFQNIGMGLLGSFTGALTSTGRGFSGGGPGGTQNASFVTGLLGIFKQLGGFVKTLSPLLGGLFRASVPYLQMFVKFLEQATRALLPAFTKMLVEFQPYLPVIARGLMDIVKGMVGFLNAIGPSGMKAAARIFVILTEGMAGALVALGHTINWLTENIPTWTRKIHNEWDILRHETAVIFDGIRHEIAHVWDQIFENSIGMVIRLAHNVETQFNSLRHSIANIYDGTRHDIASIWDTIWRNTVGRVQHGVADVNGWFHRLPGMILGALRGLGHSLYSFAHAALSEMWSGFKAVGGSILSWFKSFLGGIPHAILSFFHMSPPHPGSVFYDLGANIMHHLESGIKSRAGNISSHISGALGGDAAANARLARSMFPWPASMWPAFYNLEMREAGFNRFALNPSSGAYGIPQALPPTKMPYAAQAAGGSHAGAQLSWMFSYIAQRYGSPLAAWAHEVSAGWYDRGGWLPTGLSLALNTTGRPERVGGSAGNTYNITVNVPPTANKADIGRVTVEAIREFEKRSGKGWRS